MKRFWKILGISLVSILAVIIIAAVVAIYMVFTPTKLTPIVRNVANDYIATEHEIGDVELTFFSTFPNAAVKINGLLVVNPMIGAQSDTVLCSPEVIAQLDLLQLLHGSLKVDGLQINKTIFNGFINESGQANFDVLNIPSDSTEEDTTAFTLPFDKMDLEDMLLSIDKLSYLQLPAAQTMQQDSTAKPIIVYADKGLVKLSDVVAVGDSGKANLKLELDNVVATVAELAVSGSLSFNTPVSFDFDNMHFGLEKSKLQLTNTDLAYKLEPYVISGNLDLQSDITAELNTKHFALKNTRLTYNELTLGAYADAIIYDNGDILLDADVDVKKWDISDVIDLLPKSILAKLDGMTADGLADITATAKGVYSEKSMPVVDAVIGLENGKFAYKSLPFDLKQAEAQLEMHLDVNDSSRSVAHVKRLVACALDSKVDAFGNIDYLFADNMGADITARFNINLPDIKDFLPQEMSLKGRADGKASFKGKIADVTAMKLARTTIDGKISLTKLDFAYDSMAVKSDKADITLRIPNSRAAKKDVNFLKAHLDVQGLSFAKEESLNAIVGTTQASIETSDILNKSELLKANVKFNTDRLKAYTDSLSAELTMPDLKAYLVYNTKDSTAIPLLDADFAIEDIDVFMDTIEAHIVEPRGAAHLAAGKQNSKEPAIKTDFSLGSLTFKMGHLADIKTDNLSLSAGAERNSKKENILLQWNPEVNVRLNNGDIAYQNFASKIKIPNIDFDYSNQDFNITEGQLLIGKSDFSLSGEIRNIGPWLDETGDLRGELVLYSDYTDVPEIMSLTSGIGEEKDKSSQQESASENQEGDPYMVPKGVHLSLNTQINKALLPFINETAYDLGGGVYVRDGILVIEEMGFICNAAKLQLTAMYETPRRNNLFVGLDYHMLDIDLERLVDMIPQVDTVLPMLRSFRGNAEFHLAAETYLNSKYEVKWSTTRGACSIAGHNLTLIDGQTFTNVAKLLNFKNKKAENQVDSISAEITLFRKEIDVYPFLVTMDKYKAAVGGRHNLDMTCDYHVSLLSPTYMGVNISGAMSDIIDKPLKHIKLEKAKYAQDFLPQYRGEVESQNQTLRQMIREALKENVY